MFTGIVEDVGTVDAFVEVPDLVLWDGSRGAGNVLTVRVAPLVLEDCYIGASIAINGVCLTVTRMDGQLLDFGVAPETLRLTNLADATAGDRVNVERAAKSDARNSGHYVQGHVDGTARVVEFRREGDSLWVTLRPEDPSLMRYVVRKGFVAIDGTSLTVCDVTETTFNFMLVQHTQNHVVMPTRRVGEDRVNVEVDVVAKYGDNFALASRVSELEGRLSALEKRLSAAKL